MQLRTELKVKIGNEITIDKHWNIYRRTWLSILNLSSMGHE
jgi:hypothetical protein